MSEILWGFLFVFDVLSRISPWKVNKQINKIRSIEAGNRCSSFLYFDCFILASFHNDISIVLNMDYSNAP